MIAARAFRSVLSIVPTWSDPLPVLTIWRPSGTTTELWLPGAALPDPSSPAAGAPYPTAGAALAAAIGPAVGAGSGWSGAPTPPRTVPSVPLAPLPGAPI